MSGLDRDLRALGWSTLDLLRRLMREKHVVRSLLWPIALVPLTLMLTVFGFVWFEGDWPVGVQAGTEPEVAAALREAGFTVEEVADARAAVEADGMRTATDGRTLFTGSARGRALQVERALRRHRGADWMVAPARPPRADETQGARVMGVIGVLFVLFGVVFGAGMVARDRDDGTLEAELALGVSRWVHGAARWIAGSTVLFAHYALAVGVLHAILGVQGAGEVARHGIAACLASVAVGVLVIGRAGLKVGFSGPLASGLSIASGLVALGLAAPGVGRHVPVASMLAGGPGWTPLFGAIALGGLAVGVFTRRSARA